MLRMEDHTFLQSYIFIWRQINFLPHLAHLIVTHVHIPSLRFISTSSCDNIFLSVLPSWELAVLMVTAGTLSFVSLCKFYFLIVYIFSHMLIGSSPRKLGTNKEQRLRLCGRWVSWGHKWQEMLSKSKSHFNFTSSDEYQESMWLSHS